MPRVESHKIQSSAEKKRLCFKCKRPYFASELESFKVPSSWNSLRGVIDVCSLNHACRMYADWMRMQRFTKI